MPSALMVLSPLTFQSQQKCIVIFALVCCFAVLVALIFSAVDIMGEDEDGLSEKNCQNKCRLGIELETYQEEAVANVKLENKRARADVKTTVQTHAQLSFIMVV
ncbi:Inactive phospholipase D5 [Cricetulus griseus]|uniref:Inactive phospholipase D5 n=1 Tax=Cricetulus griseus TaxID=10029 RepID=G3H6M1_CRIGR|nr:Inactive phospholipase D5 [Cricetulus griseus]